MYLFDNRDPEVFLLFVYNFKNTLKDSGMLKTGSNTQYIQTQVYGEALHQFDAFYSEVEIDSSETLSSIILGLGTCQEYHS